MEGKRTLKSAAAAAMALVCLAAFAQNATRVNGSFSRFDPDGSHFQGTFSCSGTPICSGRYEIKEHEAGCNNDFVRVDELVITGLNLAQPGPILGQISVKNADVDHVRDSNGTCTIVPGSFVDKVFSYSGTWSGSVGNIVIVDNQKLTNATFTAIVNAPPPPFQMTVSARVDATTASASANIQFRAQDVGTNGKVFVFAIAPSTVVKRGTFVKSEGAPPVADEQIGRASCRERV